MNKEQLIQQLIEDEALKLKPYKDSVGKLTIGIGRNLDDVGLSREEAVYLCNNDIARTLAELTQAIPWITSLDDARQNVLINMAFNMGVSGLLQFKQTLGFVQAGRYKEAATAMLQSKWATQVGDRAKRLASVMEG